MPVRFHPGIFLQLAKRGDRMHRQLDALGRIARLPAQTSPLRRGGLTNIVRPFQQEDVSLSGLGESVSDTATDGAAADNNNLSALRRRRGEETLWLAHNQIGKRPALPGNLRRLTVPGIVVRLGLAFASFPLTPALSPRRGRNIRPWFGNTTELGCRVPAKRKTKQRGLQPQRASSPTPCQRSPSPWGEGWGEGERSKLQPQAHDDSRNCQTSRVPRQAPGVSQFGYNSEAGHRLERF